jgi:hypothetical protein
VSFKKSHTLTIIAFDLDLLFEKGVVVLETEQFLIKSMHSQKLNVGIRQVYSASQVLQKELPH